MRAVLRIACFLLAFANLLIFCSVNKIVTTIPMATRTETQVGFEPSPWLTFEETYSEKEILRADGKTPGKLVTQSHSWRIDFPAWSWAFAGAAVFLFILVRVLKPAGKDSRG